MSKAKGLADAKALKCCEKETSRNAEQASKGQDRAHALKEKADQATKKHKKDKEEKKEKKEKKVKDSQARARTRTRGRVR